MDVSPKTLREVEFREKMRGYHPEDVDQFLERVAAGIEVLQDRLRQAIERAQRAEQAATEAGGNDDALRRTLLLAQRTADLAVQEGREQAARIVAAAEQQFQAKLGDAEQRVQSAIVEAEQRAQATIADAERRANSMVSEAELHARRGHDDAIVEVRAELAKLEVTRQRVQMDIDAMTRWVGEHRNALRSALEEALSRVEQIEVSAPPAPGAPYQLDTPAAPALASAAVAAPTATARLASEPTLAWAPPSAPAAPDNAAPARSAQPNVVAWQPDEAEGVASDDGGDADPYFAELRRAISDRDPLGPEDGGAQAAAGATPRAESTES
jgi:cell division initiation protein